MALLEIESLEFGYTRQPVIENLSLSFAAGSATAILGPNGSGKSTLLKLLLGLLRPRKGTIWLDGMALPSIPLRQLARKVAYVPQVHREAFGYSVFDVALMGRMPHSSLFSRYSEKDRDAVREALERMEISHLAARPYTQISGGERQLTLIARALAQGAGVFVMDEPTNSLDYGNQVRLLERIGNLSADGFTFIFTTHHPDHAMAIADRVVMMQKGRIVRDGAPEAVIGPETLASLYGLPPGLFAQDAGRHGSVPRLRRAATL
ncbi:MAG: ABC transporter ATP-binding protein [Acidobacteriota bacterium]|nr:ABC transporter ATP-binding protein [Acidobacteriota bacterium]